MAEGPPMDNIGELKNMAEHSKKHFEEVIKAVMDQISTHMDEKGDDDNEEDRKGDIPAIAQHMSTDQAKAKH